MFSPLSPRIIKRRTNDNIQVSLLGGLDPEKHLKMGNTLKKLVDERDVLVVGSGQVRCDMEGSINQPGWSRPDSLKPGGALRLPVVFTHAEPARGVNRSAEGRKNMAECA